MFDSYNLLCESDLTSILRLNGDDALPLWTEALCGSSLNFKLVGNILSQIWDGQTGLSTVSVHLEGAHVTWRKQETEIIKTISKNAVICNYKLLHCVEFPESHLHHAAVHK